MSTVIELQKIFKDYELGRNIVTVLKGIDITITEGEFVTIMGPSGSGKSTLLNILGCLDIPSGGEYYLDGDLVSDKTDAELSDVRSRNIGFIFQNFNLIPELTALENVLLPQFYVDKEDEDRAIDLLTMVGLDDRLDHKPSELSGGQRQRVAIARSLINDPPLLLADEPTGNLDSKTGQEILNVLSDLHQQGRTIVIVTHDPGVAELAERSIVLGDGEIVQDQRK